MNFFAQSTPLNAWVNLRITKYSNYFNMLSCFSERRTMFLRAKEPLLAIEKHTFSKSAQLNIDRNRNHDEKMSIQYTHTHINELNLNCLLFFCIYSDLT